MVQFKEVLILKVMQVLMNDPECKFCALWTSITTLAWTLFSCICRSAAEDTGLFKCCWGGHLTLESCLKIIDEYIQVCLFFFFFLFLLVAKLCPTLATPWTVACQAPLSMGFSRQEYWSGLPFPSPGGLPNPGTEPGSPALQADSLWTELCGMSVCCCLYHNPSRHCASWSIPFHLYLIPVSFSNPVAPACRELLLCHILSAIQTVSNPTSESHP